MKQFILAHFAKCPYYICILRRKYVKINGLVF